MSKFDELTNSTLLEDLYLDRVLHRLAFKDYPNREYMTEERIWGFWLCS